MIESNVSIEERLRGYYARTEAPIDELEKARVVAMVSNEVAQPSLCERQESVPFWRFIAGQLRFVNPLAWVLQIVLLITMFLIVSAYGSLEVGMLVVMTSAILSVALAIPSVFKSFENDVSELEASCRHDSAQVLVCRLALFGFADVLWMSATVLIVPTLAGSDPFRVFLYAATPFFAFCAICFYLSRRTHGRCVKACATAVSCVVIVLWVANSVLPHWYFQVSMIVWVIALMVSLALAIYEARRLVLQVAADSVAHMPYLA